MKTVAELKRAIKLGAKLAATFHQAYDARMRDERGDVLFTDEYKGIREVSIVQTTQFALKTFYRKDSTYRDSWMPFPKRDEVVFNADGSFTILAEDFRDHSPTKGTLIPLITYSFQPETAAQVEFLKQSLTEEG